MQERINPGSWKVPLTPLDVLPDRHVYLPRRLGPRQTVHADSVTPGGGFGPRGILISGGAGDKGEPCQQAIL